jgi:AbrB family looped-hinge helix DNA binding protein
MSTTISMDKAGRIILPKLVRERLHLRANSKLDLNIIADRIELTPIADTPNVRLVRKGKRLVLAGLPPLDDEQVVAAIQADRDERIEQLSGRGRRS